MYDETAAESLDFHHSMLLDDERTRAFLRAILATVRPGDVVVDVGTGTGVLSLFAALAGARRVYAIEREPIAELARSVAERNGLADRIVVVDTPSVDWDVDEPVDVLITETIGNMGLDEGIIEWVADARARFLRADARVVPRTVRVCIALVESSHDHEVLSRWKEPFRTFDLSALHRIAMNNLVWADLSPVSLLSDPSEAIEVDLEHGDLDAARSAIHSRSRLTARRCGTIHGIGAWFHAELSEAISLTNGPPLRTPSWQQAFLPLETPLRIEEGEEVPVRISALDGGGHFEWQVGRAVPQSTKNGMFRSLDALTSTDPHHRRSSEEF